MGGSGKRERISQTLARIVSCPACNFFPPLPEIFNYHPRETPLRSLSLSLSLRSVNRGTRRSKDRRQRNNTRRRNLVRACTALVYSNGIYNGTIIYARQRVPRPPRPGWGDEQLGWGGKESGIYGVARGYAKKTPRDSGAPLKNTGRQTANISGDVPPPLFQRRIR